MSDAMYLKNLRKQIQFEVKKKVKTKIWDKSNNSDIYESAENCSIRISSSYEIDLLKNMRI